MLWLIERVHLWENSCLKKLLAHFPVRLLESLSQLRSLLEQAGYEANQPTYLFVHLDSLGLNLQDALALLEPYRLLERCVFVSQTFKEKNAAWQSARVAGGFLSIPAHTSACELFNLLNRQGVEAKLPLFLSPLLKCANVEFDFTKMQIKILPHGELRSLPLKEARLLNLLMQHPQKCWSRQELHAMVWDGIKVSPRTIDSHISRLRKKLQDSQLTIENRYGDGYMLA